MILHLNYTSINAMFTTPVNGTYIPLPLLSFAVEYNLFGLIPLPFHISNLVLHLICTLLVFKLLRLLNLDSLYAAFGALLFGIHPMHAESVAWITERKDLVYSLFYLCSLILYVIYVKKQDRGWMLIFLSILFFILSLFSKIQAVALPLGLFLVDYLLERPLKPRLIFEKIPYLVLSLLFGILGIIILKDQGVLWVNESYTLFQRIFFGLFALSAFIIKFLAPFHLSAVYPFPITSPGHSLPLLYYLSPLFLLLIGFLIYRSARYTRAVVFGSLFFLFNIMFLLQVVGAGLGFMSDRYSYISYIGLIFIVAWSIEKITKEKKTIKYILLFGLSMVMILFISLTFNRCKTWKDGVTLWTDVIEKYPKETTLPYLNRGDGYLTSGHYEKAIADFSMLNEIDPKDEVGYMNIGFIYYLQKDLDKAIDVSLQALKINPRNVTLCDNLACYYLEKGDNGNAVYNFRKCIELDNKRFDVKLGLAIAYFNQADMINARRYLEEAKILEPRLKKGMEGVAELENSGYSYSPKTKAVLTKMFEELK